MVKAGLENSKALVGLRTLSSHRDLLFGSKANLPTSSAVPTHCIPTEVRHRSVRTQFRHHLVHQLVPIVPNGPGFHRFGLLDGTPLQEVLQQLTEGRTTAPLLEVFLLLLLQVPGVPSCLQRPEPNAVPFGSGVLQGPLADSPAIGTNADPDEFPSAARRKTELLIEGLAPTLARSFYDDLEAVTYPFLLHLVGRRQRPNLRVCKGRLRIPTSQSGDFCIIPEIVVDF